MTATVPVGELAAACRAARAQAGATRVVAIDGRSGSGKTTLALRLAATLPAPDGTPAPVVHLDDLYPGWDGLAAAPDLVRRWLLAPLAEGRPAGYPRHDWAADRTGPWQPVPPAPLLILEGVGSGARCCAPYLSLLVWLDAPTLLRRARALDRDGDPFARQWDRWARQEEDYLTTDDPRARADIRGSHGS